jgi:AraC-like DNA-binding protein
LTRGQLTTYSGMLPRESDKMKPTFYRPHASLARFVEYFWTFAWGERDTVRTLRMFATGVSGILLQHYDGRPALGATAGGYPVNGGGCPTSFVYGKRTRASRTFSNGPFGLTGVVFTPQGLRRLLHTQPMVLNDTSAALGNFSKEPLGEQLLNANCDQRRLDILSNFLRSRIDSAGAEDLLVTESLDLMRAKLHSIRVPQLLKSLNVSERQLERRFVHAIGVSPHQYIRILRFRKAVQLMKANRFARLGDVACELNYVDQSHFIKDIRAFSAYTPKHLIQAVAAGVELPCAVVTPNDLAAEDHDFTSYSCGTALTPQRDPTA